MAALCRIAGLQLGGATQTGPKIQPKLINNLRGAQQVYVAPNACRSESCQIYAVSKTDKLRKKTFLDYEFPL
jgi:hypothetical protein